MTIIVKSSISNNDTEYEEPTDDNIKHDIGKLAAQMVNVMISQLVFDKEGELQKSGGKIVSRGKFSLNLGHAIVEIEKPHMGVLKLPVSFSDDMIKRLAGNLVPEIMNCLDKLDGSPYGNVLNGYRTIHTGACTNILMKANKFKGGMVVRENSAEKLLFSIKISNKMEAEKKSVFTWIVNRICNNLDDNNHAQYENLIIDNLCSVIFDYDDVFEGEDGSAFFDHNPILKCQSKLRPRTVVGLSKDIQLPEFELHYQSHTNVSLGGLGLGKYNVIEIDEARDEIKEIANSGDKCVICENTVYGDTYVVNRAEYSIVCNFCIQHRDIHRMESNDIYKFTYPQDIGNSIKNAKINPLKKDLLMKSMEKVVPNEISLYCGSIKFTVVGDTYAVVDRDDYDVFTFSAYAMRSGNFVVKKR